MASDIPPWAIEETARLRELLKQKEEVIRQQRVELASLRQMRTWLGAVHNELGRCLDDIDSLQIRAITQS